MFQISLVICDLRFESQIAIAVKSRDLENLDLKSQMVQDQFIHVMLNHIDHRDVTQEATIEKIKLSDSIPHVAPMGFQ